MPANDPLRNFRYRLEIDGIVQAGFSEVAIGDASNDPIEYREGNEITTVRKRKGLNKCGNVTLKWGLTDSIELSNWHRKVVDDATPLAAARKTVVIRIQNEAGEDKAARQNRVDDPGAIRPGTALVVPPLDTKRLGAGS